MVPVFLCTTQRSLRGYSPSHCLDHSVPFKIVLHITVPTTPAGILRASEMVCAARGRRTGCRENTMGFYKTLS